MKTHNKIRVIPSIKSGEAGVALLFAMFALLLVSAIAVGMIVMSDTETSISQNYREAQAVYYDSEAGLEEVRDRLRTTGASRDIVAPTGMPATASPNIVYVTNPAGASDSVTPWTAGTTYFDDELCHDGFSGLGLTNPGNNIRCTTAPTGTTWYRTPAVSSLSPYTNTAGALNFKWVRISLKANSTAAPIYVNGSSAAATLATQICWDGSIEQLLPSGRANCAANGWTDVVQLASLAVTPRGSRRMTVMEVVTGISIPIRAAVFSQGNTNFGNSLNVTGNNPSCPPNVSGGLGGGYVHEPGGGNVLGSPSGVHGQVPDPIPGGGAYNGPPSPWPYGNLNNTLIPTMAPYANSINSVPGITKGTPTATANPATSQQPVSPGLTLQIDNYSGTPTGTLGTAAAPQITLAAGNLDISHLVGYGVLIVQGNLTLHAGAGAPELNWRGLILATGNVDLLGNGSPQINGAIIAGGNVGALGGGFDNVSITADPCAINNTFKVVPKKVVAFREVTY